MRFALALAVSVFVHAALAALLALWLASNGGTDVMATLDVSSVELSFAEEDDTTAEASPALQSAPAAPPASAAPVPRDAEPPPPIEGSVAMPSKPSVEMPPRPQMELERMETPPPTPSEPTQSAAPSAPRQAKVDAPPRPATTIRPDYPKGARRRGEQGDVTLEMRIGADGTVVDARIAGSCGHLELDEAALKAVRAAKFAPARSGGKAVASTARLTLTFRLK